MSLDSGFKNTMQIERPAMNMRWRTIAALLLVAAPLKAQTRVAAPSLIPAIPISAAASAVGPIFSVPALSASLPAAPAVLAAPSPFAAAPAPVPSLSGIDPSAAAPSGAEVLSVGSATLEFAANSGARDLPGAHSGSGAARAPDSFGGKFFDGSIGEAGAAAEHIPDDVTHPAAWAIYKKTPVQGATIPFFIRHGRIDISEHVTTTAKSQLLYKQIGPTCVFGALCNFYQGVAGVKPTDVLAAIRRENSAFSTAIADSGLKFFSVERILSELAMRADRTLVELDSVSDFLTHMRRTGRPVLVLIQSGVGGHALVLSEALVAKGGQVYFKTLDTNISTRPGSNRARQKHFGIITAEDLRKIIAVSGFSLI
jgi:hypothetical protein